MDEKIIMKNKLKKAKDFRKAIERAGLVGFKFTNNGCGKKMDALGHIHCGDEILENSIPQGKYFRCSKCDIEYNKKVK